MPRYSFIKPFSKFLIVSLLVVGFSPTLVFAADVLAPVTTATLTPASPDGKNGWYVTPVTVELTATDLESGVKSINYKINSEAWQTVVFTNSLNLAPNPSLEDLDGANTPAIQHWSATTLDSSTTYTRDVAEYAPNYDTTSAKIVSTGTGWHGINNQITFATASPFANMHASVWFKTEGVAENAFFKVYVVSQDTLGNKTYTYLTQSTGTTGTTGWIEQSADFVVNSATAVGIYLDIGYTGTGTIWTDAVTINNSNANTSTSFIVGTNGENTVEYYSIDNANNQEAHSCASNLKCKKFKIDQSPPGNWHDAGAIRGLFGSDHELYVYATVEDPISGLSVFTDKFQYHTENNSGFGTYSNLLSCNSTWQSNNWKILISPPFSPGVHSAYVITPKTDFCNNNWKICKVVRFYAEDMAGNTTTKDFCLNGPWIQFIGKGIVRSNGGIDMIAEPEGDNTDGLVELGNDLYSFFSTSTDWVVQNATEVKNYDYDKWKLLVKPSPTTTSTLSTNSGSFLINNDFEITNSSLPNNYDSATFSQIIFINGDLKISRDIAVGNNSAAVYIVKGKVEIDKGVNNIKIGIFADGDFYTAYNLAEGSTANTLELAGVFSANKFWFQRTLQGTNNSKYPSEKFTYEPKYTVKLADYLGTNAVKWVSVN